MDSRPNTFFSTGLDVLSRNVARSGINPVNQKSADTDAYVDTANTSQISGLRKLGHRPMVFGYGNSQYAASHGRPVCTSGKMAAQATANSVIASAKRLMEVRQSCLKSSRMAEISVPAWPMPIHQTKLMMSKAQPTGTLLPQMPMPLARRLPMVRLSTISRMNAMKKPRNQP